VVWYKDELMINAENFVVGWLDADPEVSAVTVYRESTNMGRNLSRAKLPALAVYAEGIDPAGTHLWRVHGKIEIDPQENGDPGTLVDNIKSLMSHVAASLRKDFVPGVCLTDIVAIKPGSAGLQLIDMGNGKFQQVPYVMWEVTL